MSEIAAMLDHATQDEIRRVLTEAGHDDVVPIADEALAAMAILARQPSGVRRATLTIMPIGIRHDLDAFRLACRPDAARPGWELTSKGTQVAAVLSATLPEPGPDADQRAAAALKQVLADVQDELGRATE